jgi:hypothetical protein
MAFSECQRTVAMSETILTATSSPLQLPIMSAPANKTAVLPEDRAQGKAAVTPNAADFLAGLRS